MQKSASINNANWDLLSYLSSVDTSWQLKISILLQRCITCLFFSFLHVNLFFWHWLMYILCQFFGLKKSSSLSDFALAGEQFCNQDLSTLREKYPNRSDEDFSRYCFSSAYIVALLHDSLGVPLDDKRQAYWTHECSSVHFTLEQCLTNLIFSLSGLSIPTRLETFRLNGP
jgi:hypothetical protein